MYIPHGTPFNFIDTEDQLDHALFKLHHRWDIFVVIVDLFKLVSHAWTSNLTPCCLYLIVCNIISAFLFGLRIPLLMVLNFKLLSLHI